MNAKAPPVKLFGFIPKSQDAAPNSWMFELKKKNSLNIYPVIKKPI